MNNTHPNTAAQPFPKLELHLHLEGAAPPEFIRRLAREKNKDISGIFDDQGHYRFDGFVDFLRVYEAASSVLETAQDYARLVEVVIAACEAHGVLYAETFISPDFCGGGDIGAWREYVHAMQEVAERAEARGGITLRGIVTCVRHFGAEKARASALCAAHTAGPWIVGFGMGGDENYGAARDYAWAFDCAREAGLGLTCHAGEWQGPQSVRDAVYDLGATRIGHGVRAAEDLALVDALAQRGTVLECCPGSNIALGLYPSWAQHPVEFLATRGVNVTISTDDPPFFHTDMSLEFSMLEKTFGWQAPMFRQLNQTALEGAFCDGATKERLTKKLKEYT